MRPFAAAAVLLFASIASAGNVFYETGFEPTQGYSAGALDGQDSWATIGSGMAEVIAGADDGTITGQALLLQLPKGPGAVGVIRQLPSEFASISFDIRFDAPPGARGGNSDAELEIRTSEAEFIHLARFVNGTIEIVAGSSLVTVGSYTPGVTFSIRFDNLGDGMQRVYLNDQIVHSGISTAAGLGRPEAVPGEFRFIVDGDLDAIVDNLRYAAPAAPCAADLSGDGAVGSSDLAEMLAAWGPCPGARATTTITFDPFLGYVAGPLDGQMGWSADCAVLEDIGIAEFGDLSAILNENGAVTSCRMTYEPDAFHGAVSATVVYDASSGTRGSTAPAVMTFVDTVTNFQILNVYLSRSTGNISVRTRGGFEIVATRSGFTILDIRAELYGDDTQRIYLDGELVYEGLSARPDNPMIDEIYFASGSDSLIVDNITLIDLESDPCPADFTGDDVVGSGDLAELLAAWGACP